MPTTTVTVGTSGRDYSTLGAAIADLDNGAVFTAGDDAVLELYDDSDFTESNINLTGGSTLGLNSVRVTSAPGNGHNGTMNSGVRFVSGSVNPIIKGLPSVNTTVDWIEFNGNANSNTVFDFAGGNADFTIRRCLVHSTSIGAGTAKYGISCGILTTGYKFQAIRNFVFNIRRTAGTGNAQVIGIRDVITVLSSKTINKSNNTVWNVLSTTTFSNVTYGINQTTSGSENICKNNLVGGVSSSGTADAFDYATFGDTTNVSNNGSEDSTAPGSSSLTTVTSADFVSTVLGSENLHLASGSAVGVGAGVDLGTTPPGIEIDIDGYDVDAGGNPWDMGAHQYVTGGGAVIPVFYNHLQTQGIA
jgi:hypothetical protein